MPNIMTMWKIIMAVIDMAHNSVSTRMEPKIVILSMLAYLSYFTICITYMR